MDIDLKPYTREYQAYLIKLAADNLDKGIIYEPRAYFDEIAVNMSASIPAHAQPNVFNNGERFPVRLTHMTMGISYLTTDDPAVVSDERNIQLMGVGMKFHDQWYMNDKYVAAPLWANEVISAATHISEGTAGWRFARPFILSSRDSLNVKVQLLLVAESAIPVTVSFTGVGIKSKRPYFLSGDTALSNTILTTIPSSNYRNDGAEPILITDMTINAAGAIAENDPVGAIRNLRIQINQLGNGTGSNWFIGPTTVTPALQGIAAQNLGQTTGRVVVHRFPGNGVLWEPGEGIDIWVQRLASELEDLEGVKFNVALLGYMAVQ